MTPTTPSAVVIDGQGSVTSGLVQVASGVANGLQDQVTIEGLTLTNPGITGYDASLQDGDSSDTVTLRHDVFKGNDLDNGAVLAVNVPVEPAGQDCRREQHVRRRLPGSPGRERRPAHGLRQHVPEPAELYDGTSIYGGEGIHLLSDHSGLLDDQVVTGNTFTGYQGWGVKVEAGYAAGGCSQVTCDGNGAVTITGNTFTLTANGSPRAHRESAAITLNAENSTDALDATLGDNTGTVVSPVATINEPGSGIGRT